MTWERLATDTTAAFSQRPFLRRDGSVPPPRQPPPNPPPEIPQVLPQSSESLSVAQIRQYVGTFRFEDTPYAFVYQDAASLPEELEEWFSYSIEERARIAKTHASFAQQWTTWNDAEGAGYSSGDYDWTKTTPSRRKRFITSILAELSQDNNFERRLCHLEALVYLALGSWNETAGLTSENWTQYPSHQSSYSTFGTAAETDDASKKQELNSIQESTYQPFGKQIEWIRKNCLLILESQGARPILDLFMMCIDREL